MTAARRRPSTRRDAPTTGRPPDTTNRQPEHHRGGEPWRDTIWRTTGATGWDTGARAAAGWKAAEWKVAERAATTNRGTCVEAATASTPVVRSSGTGAGRRATAGSW